MLITKFFILGTCLTAPPFEASNITPDVGFSPATAHTEVCYPSCHTLSDRFRPKQNQSVSTGYTMGRKGREQALSYP